MGCGVILTVTDTKDQLRAQPYLLAAKPQPKRAALQSKPSRINITIENQTQKIFKDPSQSMKKVKQDGNIQDIALLPHESVTSQKDIALDSGRRKIEGGKSSMEVKYQYQAVVNHNNNSTQRSSVPEKKENAALNINSQSEQAKQNGKHQVVMKAQKKQAVVGPNQKIVVSTRQKASGENKQIQNANKYVKKENEKTNQAEKKASSKQEQKGKKDSSLSNGGGKKDEKSPTIMSIKKQQAQPNNQKEEPKPTNSATLNKEQSKPQLVQSTKLTRQQSNKNKPPTDRIPNNMQNSTASINKPHPGQSSSNKEHIPKEEQKHFDRKDLVQTSYISNTSKKPQPAVTKQSLINKPKASKTSKKQLNEVSSLFLDAEVLKGTIPSEKENIVTAKETIAHTQVEKGPISSRPASRQQLKTGGQVKNKNLINIRESKSKDPLLDTLENVHHDSKLEKQIQDECLLEENAREKDISSRKSLVTRKEIKAAELQRDLKKIRQSMKKIQQEEKKKLEKESNTLKKIYNL